MAENTNNNIIEDVEEFDSLITLSDENGEEVEFELLDVIEYNNDEYIVLIENVEDADEVVILKIQSLDEENEEYVSIDDEDLLQTIFNLFKSRYSGTINFE